MKSWINKVMQLLCFPHFFGMLTYVAVNQMWCFKIGYPKFIVMFVRKKFNRFWSHSRRITQKINGG